MARSHSSFVVGCAILLVLGLAFLPRFQAPGRPKADMSLALRPAQASDLEAMTAIAIAAFPFDPQWPYRYPYREEYPDEHYHYVRLGLEEYLARAAEKANEIMVVEAPDKDNPDLIKVIAFSIWDNPGTSKDGKGT